MTTTSERCRGRAWKPYLSRRNDPDSFGARMLALRVERGWTRQELADRAGLSVCAIYMHEGAYTFRHDTPVGLYGAPERRSLHAIANALGIPACALIPVMASQIDTRYRHR